jgi:hypothetical protein
MQVESNVRILKLACHNFFAQELKQSEERSEIGLMTGALEKNQLLKES